MKPNEIQSHREKQDELLADSQKTLAAAECYGREPTVTETDAIKANSLEFNRLTALIDAQESVVDQEAMLSRSLGRLTEPDDIPLADSTYRPRAHAGPRPRARGIGDSSERKVFAHFADVLRGSRPMAAMSVGSDPDGGYLVPTTVDRRIADQLIDLSPMRRHADVVRSETSDYRRIVNVRGTGSGWAGELSTRTETDAPDLKEVHPPHGELFARPMMTNWLLMDNGFNVESFIDQNVSTEFALREGEAFISGDGINQPRGILTHQTATTDDDTRAFGTIQHKAAASSTALDEDEIIDLLYLLRPSYRAGSGTTWFMNSTTAAAVRKLKDDNGQFLWVNGLQPGQPAMLLGHAVAEMEAMDDIAAGKFPIAIANWPRAYVVVDIGSTTMIRDEITKKGWTSFYFAKRVGGALLDSNAIKLLKMA